MPNGRITLHDIYEINGDIREDIKELRCALDKACERIGILETWRANITGRIAIITGFLTVTATLAIDWLKKRLAMVDP